MNNCKRLVPAFQRLSNSVSVMIPARTFFARRCIVPFRLVERNMEDLERQLARLEREMNAAFRGGWGFPAYRFQSIFGPQTFSSANRIFPTVEVQTSPATEAGKPGKYSINIDFGEGFSPENIKISLKDHMLTINAKLERNSNNERVYQEVTRSFSLPQGINADEVKSLLSPEGILTIEAPLPEVEAPQPKEIPISVEPKSN